MTTGDIKSIPGGIYTPIPTFYKNDGEYTLDLDTQIKHAKFLYDNGINGLLVCGSMGEAAHLTSKERVRLVRELRNAISDPEFKILAGSPPLNVAELVEEIEEFYKVGADYSIILTPGYFGPALTSQGGMVEYFRSVADKSKLPLIIYNYPGVSNNVEISYQTYEAISTHPQIIGTKLTHFNLDKYALIASNPNIKNFVPFTGLGQVLVPSLSVGAHGAIDGLSGIFPKVMLRLLSLAKESQNPRARELQFLVARADLMIAELNLVGVKYALNRLYGLGDTITGRPPLSAPITDEQWKKFEEDYNSLLKLEKSL